MLRFLFGFVLVAAVLLAFNVYDPSAGSWSSDNTATLLIYFGPLACIAAALCAALLQYSRRAPLFAHLARMDPTPIIFGLGAAVLNVCLSIVLVVLLDRYVFDWLLVTVSSTLASGVVLLFVRRARPGHCIRCDYDIRTSLTTGRCPECGTAITG